MRRPGSYLRARFVGLLCLSEPSKVVGTCEPPPCRDGQRSCSDKDERRPNGAELYAAGEHCRDCAPHDHAQHAGSCDPNLTNEETGEGIAFDAAPPKEHPCRPGVHDAERNQRDENRPHEERRVSRSRSNRVRFRHARTRVVWTSSCVSDRAPDVAASAGCLLRRPPPRASGGTTPKQRSGGSDDRDSLCEHALYQAWQPCLPDEGRGGSQEGLGLRIGRPERASLRSETFTVLGTASDSARVATLVASRDSRERATHCHHEMSKSACR